MADWLVVIVPGLWIAAGVWSALLALQLLSVSSEDRGAVKLFSRETQDPGLLVVANKMVRLSYNRLGISLFAIMAGIILIFDELTERSADGDGFSVPGLILVVGFLGMVITQGVISALDLRDREKLTSVPSEPERVA